MKLINLINCKKTFNPNSEELMDRVISFSVAPTDTKGQAEIKKLKQHCKKTGISFSYLVIKAITKMNKELKL